jgi:hypothetical protein
VRGVNFQPAFHAGRFGVHDPLQRITNPDVLRLLEAQTEGAFRVADFVPVPCCFPSCNSVSYALIDGQDVTPLARLLKVDDYLDYLTNRAIPDAAQVKGAIERLWSSAAVPGSEGTGRDFALACAACGVGGAVDLRALMDGIFIVMLQDFMDPWTFNQKNVMKCCKEILLPDGKQIPFCAYNSVGYREQARVQLAARQRARQAGWAAEPLAFRFPIAREPGQ